METCCDEAGRLPMPPVLDRPVRLAVLISGGGTTLLNFLNEISAGTLHAEIPLVIASREDCAGVARARSAGLRCDVIRRRDFGGTPEFSEAVFAGIRDQAADLVILAGYLSLLRIPADFEHRVLNIHPALIPSFCGHGYHGHHVHEAAIERGVKVSGCTVHFADNAYDQGPIILQRTVVIPDGCDANQLAERVFREEKRAYPEAIRLVAGGRVRICGRRTIILPEPE